jgi:hypothetical protein
MIILRIEEAVIASRLQYHCVGKYISMALAPEMYCCVSCMSHGVQDELAGEGRIKEAHFGKLRIMTSKYSSSSFLSTAGSCWLSCSKAAVDRVVRASSLPHAPCVS